MQAETVLSAAELRALWLEMASDERLVDPYELTEHGEIVMSPRPTNRHQIACSMLAAQIQQKLGAMVVVEAAVLTKTAGVRVPDLVWMPAERWSGVMASGALVESPDLVVEVLSPGNRAGEIRHKVRAHLDSGTREVVVVGLDGSMRYQRADGVHAESSFALALALPSELLT